MVPKFIYQKEDLYLRQISGNKLLVKALKEEGVDTLFGYPGACTIDISDELYRQSGIDIILPRHEQALVHEADAYARTTGKVGVCLVTSGPGATNLVTGVADAYLDGAPLVAITGQVGTDRMQLTSHQYLDLTAMFEPITKRSKQIIRLQARRKGQAGRDPYRPAPEYRKNARRRCAAQAPADA